MKFVAGADIGNVTTEVALAKVYEDGNIEFLSSGIVKTTGIKGTKDNIDGVIDSLKQALGKVSMNIEDLDLLRINEAAPVIGDVAMETITETIITESTMIGHNPSTPGGIGLGVGTTIKIEDLENIDVKNLKKDEDFIVVVLGNVSFLEAAARINFAMDAGIPITGAILQKDNGVLVNNRLKKVIPIVDEVMLLEKVPLNMIAAVEVAPAGGVVEVLSNPYGIATVFSLNSEETKSVVPISRALIGNRSAVVIKTPKGDVEEKRIPAGKININGLKRKESVDVEEGAENIMQSVNLCAPIEDIKGEPGTNAEECLKK